MLPELKQEEQDMTNPYENISLTPYRIIAAGAGPSNVQMPDGTVLSASDLKRSMNYCQLFAWNAESKELQEWNRYKQEHPECLCDLVVDSGAYSAWSRGKAFDVDEYINYLNANNLIETCFWAAEADKIPGSFGVDPTEEERLAAPEESWNNYLYMIKRVRCPKKIVPIFHMGEDYKHLIRMLEYRFDDGDFIPYIGISPRNDVHVNEKMKWYETTWKVIYDKCAELGRKEPLTHNFGMTTISLMEQYPSCSSDSTSWVRSGSFGNISIVVNGKIKSVYVSDRNPTSPDHINNQPLAIKEAVEKECKKMGYGMSLDALINDTKGALRPLFNLFSLNEWKKSFRYEGNTQFKESLW